MIILKPGNLFDSECQTLDYEDTLNDYICEYMDINNCFPEED